MPAPSSNSSYLPRRGFAVAWASLLVGILLLAVIGRPLQRWIESMGLLGWFGIAVIGLLGLAMLGWLAHALRRLPLRRAVVVGVAAAALLTWGATFDRPEETMHILLFGLLGILATRAFGIRAGLPLIALCAGADELLQLYLPDRVGDWPDVTTNTLAGAVGWLIAWAHEGSSDHAR